MVFLTGINLRIRDFLIVNILMGGVDIYLFCLFFSSKYLGMGTYLGTANRWN